jgi:plastocyanin
MIRRSLWVLSVLAIALALVGCGGSMTRDGDPATVSTNGVSANVPANVITISGMAFMPSRLQVLPGATITVRNLDLMSHSVTSEAAMGDFRLGAMAGISFDTGPFVGERTFTIPPTAPVGAVIPFFSTVDMSTMMTPDGTIEVMSDPSMPMPMPMSMPMQR